MTHKLPQLLPECSVPTQQFCPSCRDKDGGLAFRKSILQIRGIDNVNHDFECPKGKPWGQQPLSPPPTESVIRIAIARASTCDHCEHNKGVKLTVVSGRGTEHIYRVKCGLCSTCGGGLSLINGNCKAGKWHATSQASTDRSIQKEAG